MKQMIDTVLGKLVNSGTEAGRQFNIWLRNNDQLYLNVINDATNAVTALKGHPNMNYNQAATLAAEALATAMWTKFVKSSVPPSYSPTPMENTAYQLGIDQIAALKQALSVAQQNIAAQNNYNTGGSAWGTQPQQSRGGWGNNNDNAVSITKPSTVGADLLMLGPDSVAAKNNIDTWGSSPVSSGWGNTKEEPKQAPISDISVFDTFVKTEPKIKEEPVRSAYTPLTTTIDGPVKHVTRFSKAGYNLCFLHNGAPDMKLEYQLHELNGQFFECINRHGKLVPEDHYRVADGFIGSLANKITVNDEDADEKLPILVETERTLDIAKGNFPPAIVFESVIEATKFSQAVYFAESRLLAAGLPLDVIEKTPYVFAATSVYSHQSTLRVAELASTLASCGNLNSLGTCLLELRDSIPKSIWYGIESRLTTYVNTYMRSTFPLYATIDSFVQDYTELNEAVSAKLLPNIYTADEQLAIFARITNDLIQAVGTFTAWSDEPAEGEEPKETTLVIESKTTLAVTRFTAAELQVALAAVGSGYGSPVYIQPTGGLVEELSLPNLYELLARVMEDAEHLGTNEAHLITEDGYSMRVSRPVLGDGYVLDLPIALD